MSDEECRINARLDALQAAEPTRENTEEFCWLCRELRRFSPQLKPAHPFRRQCWQVRGIIWLAAISLCVTTVLLMPFFTGDRSLAGIIVMMILGSISSFCWAVWSSNYNP
ncbi:hypothetical protein OBV_13340 [Oscillibacter valericigenes Sjm18-20]|nr:hypothetical protein OBV_13340 [Oscillibacter valericigenes Sjm18-20]